MYFMVVGFSIFGCETKPNPAPMALVKAEKKVTPPPPPLPKPAIEPISPMTISQFPHLKDYEGNLILGGPYSQIVVAGIPPDSKIPWLDGILGAFVYRNNKWHSLKLFNQIQFKVESPRDRYFFPIGMTTEQKKTHLVLNLILQSKRRSSIKSVLEFRYEQGTGFFKVRIKDPRNHRARGIQLTTRMRRGEARYLMVSTKDQQHLGITGYRGKSSFSILSLERVPATIQTGHIDLNLKGSAARRGLSVLLQEKQMNNLAYFVGVGEACSASKQKNSCGEFPKPTFFQAQSETQDTSNNPFYHPLYVWDQNKSLINYASVGFGETRSIGLFPKVTYSITELTDSQVERAQLSGLPGEQAKLTLPARTGGTIRIQLEPEIQTPAKVAIFRTDDPHAYAAFDSHNQPSVAAILTKNEALVDKWPFEAPLPSGPYLVRVINTKDGFYCTKRLNISSEQTQELTCEQSSVDPSPGTSIVNLSDEKSTSGWSDHPLKLIKTDSAISPQDTSQNDVKTLQSVQIHDSSENLTFNMFPLTPSLKEKWQKTIKRDPRPLKAFLEFKESYASDSILELACNQEPLGLAQYEYTIQRFRPNAAQIIGCGSYHYQTALLNILDRLMTKHSKRINLSVTSRNWRQALATSVHAPKLYIEAKDDEQTSEALTKGQYTISQGSFLTLKLAEGMKGKEVQYAVTPEPMVVPLRIQVKSGETIIASAPLAQSGDTPQMVGQLAIPKRTRGWFRVEVIGTQKDQVKHGGFQEIMVASSNYLKL